MAKEHLLTRTEEVVLTAVATLELAGQAYGMNIFEECCRLTKGRYISLGSIYTMLDRLENKGLVESRLEERGDSEHHGTKRYFKITEIGTQAVREAAGLSRALRRAWSTISVPHNAPGESSASMRKSSARNVKEIRAERVS
jgi:DNA-binding PadR family transcriptional regulator